MVPTEYSVVNSVRESGNLKSEELVRFSGKVDISELGVVFFGVMMPVLLFHTKTA